MLREFVKHHIQQTLRSNRELAHQLSRFGVEGGSEIFNDPDSLQDLEQSAQAGLLGREDAGLVASGAFVVGKILHDVTISIVATLIINMGAKLIKKNDVADDKGTPTSNFTNFDIENAIHLELPRRFEEMENETGKLTTEQREFLEKTAKSVITPALLERCEKCLVDGAE